MLKKMLRLKWRREFMIKRKEVQGIEEVLEVLKKYRIDWATVNKIENSLWETGVAFFNRKFCRVAYYDEVHNVLSIDRRQILRHVIEFSPVVDIPAYALQPSRAFVAEKISQLIMKNVTPVNPKSAIKGPIPAT